MNDILDSFSIEVASLASTFHPKISGKCFSFCRKMFTECVPKCVEWTQKHCVKYWDCENVQNSGGILCNYYRFKFTVEEILQEFAFVCSFCKSSCFKECCLSNYVTNRMTLNTLIGELDTFFTKFNGNLNEKHKNTLVRM